MRFCDKNVFFEQKSEARGKETRLGEPCRLLDYVSSFIELPLETNEMNRSSLAIDQVYLGEDFGYVRLLNEKYCQLQKTLLLDVQETF